MSRYRKAKQVREIMLEILEQNPDGIDSERFVTQVRKKSSVSRGKVFTEMKFLEMTDRMTIERDPKDRRKAIYKPVLQRVKADRKIYQAKEHLENLRDPIFAEISVPKGAFKAHISVFGEGKGYDPEKERRSLEQMMKLTKANLADTKLGFWQPDTFNKVVLFFMVERVE